MKCVFNVFLNKSMDPDVSFARLVLCMSWVQQSIRQEDRQTETERQEDASFIHPPHPSVSDHTAVGASE